ncbi:MAG: hypothetical protein IJ800_06900 [Clostridia bacterium]|nr:hypothetical protein [Clostridia bacterium]
MEKWYWTELIGFDNASPDMGVGSFLSRAGEGMTGVSLFLYSSEFFNSHRPLNKERVFEDGFCSYAAHPYNEERKRQKWTNFQLKKLVSLLKERGVKVVVSTFSTFIYRENGKLKVGKYGDKHLEIREFTSVKLGNFGAVSPIKNFPDGSSYGDYLVKKMKEAVFDYGFDGVHLADGLPFPVKTLQVGDYTDDLVLRFIKKYKISLPPSISGKCDADKEKTLARYRFIFENHRYLYGRFISELYGEFLNKVYDAFEGKIVTFNGVWTRDPFEGYLRYGVNNRRLCPERSDGYIFENMGASMTSFSPQESGGVEFDEEFRKNVLHDFYLSLSSLKADMPKAEIINLTPIKDTFEQWNIIENSPNQLARGISLRNSNFIFSKGKFVKSSGGANYCLSDGIKASLWDFVGGYEKVSDLKKIIGFIGVAFLYNDDLEKEVKEYISTRRLSSYEMRKRLVDCGLSFPVACDLSAVKGFRDKNPVFATNLKNYKKKDLEKLSEYEGVIITMGYEDELLGKTPSLTLKVKDSGLYCRMYNLSKNYGEILFEGGSEAGLSPYEEHDGIWTAPLRYKGEPRGFFEEIIKIVKKEYPALPLPKNGVRSYIYKVSPKKYRAYLYNDDNWFKIEKLSFPVSVKHAKSLINSTNLKSFTSDEIAVKLFNCGVEIVEIKV